MLSINIYLSLGRIRAILKLPNAPECSYLAASATVVAGLISEEIADVNRAIGLGHYRKLGFVDGLFHQGKFGRRTV